MSAALEGIRVIELGGMVSAPYCGKLLADFGADTIKVEPAGGDPARACGPFPSAEPDEEQSALFLYLNTSKRGVVLDPATVEGGNTLKRLIESADVLLDNQPPAVLQELGLGWAELAAANPRLVYTSITPYGRTGPRAGDAGDELTLIHAGGLGNLLPSRSESIDLPPVKLGGYQVGYHGAIVAALATLGALYGRERTGRGRLIDVSLQDVVLALASPLVATHRYLHTTWSRVPDRPPSMGRLRTEDGYIVLNAFDDHHFELFRELLGRPEWCAGDEWKSMAYRVHHLMEIGPQIEKWARGQKKNDLHHRAGEMGIPIGPINTAADVMASPQYEARDYFVEVDHPKAGRHRYAGWPYRMSMTPPAVIRPAPLLGEHDEEISAELSSTDAPPPPPAREGEPETDDGAELPLAGVRVLELAWVWAGPYAGQLLAALGAEVIKVESHRRTDLTRRSFVWPLPDPAPKSIPPSQGMAFNSVNMNKKSVTLDLSQREGVELARRLASHSDVVFDNLRPGALGKLGLGYEDLRKVRPDLIVASSSGRGHAGREMQYLGYAMVHQAIGGGAYITGHPEDHPCHSGGDVDLMNAMTLAFSIVAALHHRRRTGEGQFIDYSQCEGVSSLLGEVLLGYEMTGEVAERMGNRHPRHAPHNVYPAWGVDRWLAIEVHDDEQFASLARVLGQAELASDDRFANAAARKANEEDLDRILAAWTRERDRDWMVDQLTETGVPAAPSREARDLYADPHLRERGAFVEVDHPELGKLELVDAPWKMSASPPPRRPAPRLGQHTHQVLSELLGLSDGEIDDLREKDVVAG